MNSIYLILGLTLSILHLDWFLPISPAFKVTQSIDFEDAEVASNNVETNGYSFSTHSSTANMWIENEIARKGNKSLGVTLNPGESRSEMRIVDITNNDRRFVAFSVYFPEDYNIPTDWNLFAQWWQGVPASPPIAFEVTPNTNELKMRILTRSGLHTNSKVKLQYESTLPKGKWIDFLIEMKIDDTGKNEGILNVWKDNIRIVKYLGALGYTDLNPHANFRVGIYRSPNILSKSNVYFDEIKIGEHY